MSEKLLYKQDGHGVTITLKFGLSRAAQMTFTEKPINAKTAEAWGLVSQVVIPEDLLPAARALAGDIVFNPPRHLRMTKRFLRENLNTRLDSVSQLTAVYQGACHQTRDHDEAVAANLENRSAEFCEY